MNAGYMLTVCAMNGISIKSFFFSILFLKKHLQEKQRS